MATDESARFCTEKAVARLQRSFTLPPSLSELFWLHSQALPQTGEREVSTLQRASLAAVIAVLFTSTSVLATTCFDDATGVDRTGTVKYTDRTLSENYLERGGSEATNLKKFYIANQEVSRRIDDLKISVFNGDDELVAKTERGPNISAYSGMNGSANSIAVFYVPWEDFSWRLQIGYRWVNSSRKFTYLRDAYRYSWQDGVELEKDATPDPKPDTLRNCR